MTQIISDTSTLYNIKEGKEKNLEIIPLQIIVNQQSYLEFEEISSKEILEHISNGYLPTSSQPTIGSVLDTYVAHQNDSVLNITMADGLSGTYQSACLAQNQCDGDISVLNSKTLCGPHRYLVNKALQLVEEGKSKHEIIDILQVSIDHCSSFLIPQDFDFLKRGGRCSQVAASLGGLLKLTVVMKQSEDGKTLEKHSVARTYKKALSSIVESFKELGVDDHYLISIAHATDEKQVNDTFLYLQKEFPTTEIEILELSPAFIAQGGPGCLAIQTILK